MESINNESWADGGDVLFLGDSRGNQGLVPTVYEEAMAERGIQVSAFNMSRPGMQIPFAYYFSKRAMEDAKIKPKSVVVNFSFYLLGGQQWMKSIYFAYYRPSASEAYQSCVMRLMTCADASRWYVRSRLPAWMFRTRANVLARQFLRAPSSILKDFSGIYQQQQVSDFSVAKGYVSRGFGHIEPKDITPQVYKKGLETGYTVYLRYLELMLKELAARNVQVFVYQFPWPEQRQNEAGFNDILDYYWALIKKGNYQGTSVHFLDKNSFWPVDYFSDPLHLNHPGAVKLTRMLADEIASIQKQEQQEQQETSTAQQP